MNIKIKNYILKYKSVISSLYPSRIYKNKSDVNSPMRGINCLSHLKFEPIDICYRDLLYSYVLILNSTISNCSFTIMFLINIKIKSYILKFKSVLNSLYLRFVRIN